MPDATVNVDNHMARPHWEEDAEPLPAAPSVEEYIESYPDHFELLGEAIADCGFAPTDKNHPAAKVIDLLAEGDFAEAGAILNLLLRNYAEEQIQRDIVKGKYA